MINKILPTSINSGMRYSKPIQSNGVFIISWMYESWILSYMILGCATKAKIGIVNPRVIIKVKAINMVLKSYIPKDWVSNHH